MGWTPPDDGPRSARTHDRAGRPWQRLTVEVGGGAGILNSIEWVRPGVGLDVMGRLHGPLTLVGVARFSLSTDVDTHDGSSHDGDQATLLPAVGVGVGLRWASPITPVFAAWFQVAPNVAAPDVPPVLPGGRLLVGVELGLGPKAPVAFRPAVEVGFLGPYPSLFGGLSVVVRLPDATTPSPVAAR